MDQSFHEPGLAAFSFRGARQVCPLLPLVSSITTRGFELILILILAYPPFALQAGGSGRVACGAV